MHRALADGDGDSGDGSEELAEQRRINEALAEIEHTPHITVLEAVALLEAVEDRAEVRTGRVIDTADRLTPGSVDRVTVSHSLKVLYKRSYLDRERRGPENAYDWSVSGRGRALLADLGMLARLESIAEAERER